MSDQRRRSQGKQTIMRLQECPAAGNEAQIEMVGVSACFQEMKNRLMQAAAWNHEPVLLIGERGSGKEVAARALHLWSARRKQPFVPVLVPALCESLLADELFGHKHGSFTGAHDARLGKFASADGGTVFLDEIGDLSPAAQAALLRVLETGEVTPVGEDLPHRVDVRIVAATNQDLAHLIQEGRFRVDLYDRLRVFAIRVPPLRERREDIPLLAAHFLRECCIMSACAVGKPDSNRCRQGARADCATEEFYRVLMSHDWPGNVRELRSLVIRLRAEHPHSLLDQSLSGTLVIRHKPQPDSDGPPTDRDLSLESALRQHIQAVLDRVQNNVAEAARILDIPRSTLRDHIKKLGIKVQ